MNSYDHILKFKGAWRPYQERILDRADTYLKDGKIHIVAPPGSGKTTLGIELIRRLGRPCLILSPSAVIRQQWLERVKEAFIQKDDQSLLSDDIHAPALITSVTYQALHFGMEQINGPKSVFEAEQEDSKVFNLINAVKAAEIGTICLDECHHLRSEWWKSLEKFMMKMENVCVVSLTATPPYDSTSAQWERYIGLCGEIDEEIIVPELVQDHSLCPHQDYVYFNYPTEDEKAQIDAFRGEVRKVFQEMTADESFAAVAASRKGIMDPDQSADELLEKPAYLVSVLTFLEAKGIPYPKKWLKVLGIKRLPEFDISRLEQLLQGILFDDTGSYDADAGYISGLIQSLKRRKCIERRRVSLCANESIEKLLTNSRGKLKSIREIAAAEYESMGKGLNLLILTDYIRREYEKAVGDPDRPAEKIGAVPLFEMLRRELEAEIRLGVVCGELMILPSEASEFLTDTAKRILGDSSKLQLEEMKNRSGTALGYAKVTVRGKKQNMVRIATEAFEAGYVQILIGTKSLLGEGWNSPCINSLILASFVGSFVLSNQMRGRAVRIMPGNPEKTSNIWHLVCLDTTDRQTRVSRLMGTGEAELSDDFAMLSRRMKGILGISYTEDIIENGMERLDLAENHYTEKEVKRINEEMKKRAKDREGLQKKWERAAVVFDKMEITDECVMDKSVLKPGAGFFNLIGFELLAVIIQTCNLILYTGAFSTEGLVPLLFSAAATSLFVLLTIRCGTGIVRLLTPLKRLNAIGTGIRSALIQKGQISSDTKVVTEEKGLFYFVYLRGGTVREKDLFSACVDEFLGEIDNQRYLLYEKRSWNKMQSYFSVPGIFAKTRQDAGAFAQAMRKSIGNYKLVYTRNEEGRKILLKGRRHAYANQANNAEARLCGRKKKVKGALE